MTPPNEAGRVLADQFANWGKLLGRLIGASGRPDLAEDALAEAFAQAAQQWPSDGVPVNPHGWLATVAQRRLLDARRSEDRRRVPAYRAELVRRAATAAAASAEPLPSVLDERVPLLFMATHPALAEEVRPALALRFVLGVDTATIARLFLVPLPTMAARLTRAKRRLAAIGAGFRVPDSTRWTDRTDDVARSIYLAFTAGYAPGGDEVVRVAAAGDAVRLAVVAAGLLPREPVLAALAALVRLQHARRDARVDAKGNLVRLAEQNRRLWRADEMADGLARLTALVPTSGYAEEVRLQALIAAFHATAPTAQDTDWNGIARAYRRLETITGSGIVRLNRAVATAEAEGPDAGLALLAGLAERLPGHYRVALVRAELLAAGGRDAEAAAAYAEALSLVGPGAERRHIQSRLDLLNTGVPKLAD